MKMIIPALICGMMFTSCDSDKAELTENEGSFFGTYIATYFNGWPTSHGGEITIELNDGKFFMTGILHNQTEFSGNYSINGNKIIFEIKVWKTDYMDENGNRFLLDFDTNIVPQGVCNYTFDGKKLKLSKVYTGTAQYVWNLEKK